MKPLFFSFLTLILLCLPTACSDDLPKPEEKQAERTVILYMMAENSLNRYSVNDLNEIKQTYRCIPSNSNLIVYVDDSSLPRIYNVTAKKGFTEWKVFKEDHICTDSAVIQKNLQEIITNFPAKKYGLVLWSHGSGWVPQSRSIGIDNGTNTSSNSGLQMNITTLKGILERLPHFEFILFDACAMQSVEVAYELRKTTDYIIGSPTEIHAEGAPYDKILEPMMKGDVKTIVERYYETYQSWGGVVISLLNCQGIDLLAQATAKVMPQLCETLRQTGTDGVQIYYPYSSYSNWIPEPFDIDGIMHHALDSANYAEWKTQLDRTILYKGATSSWTSVFPGHNHCNLTDDTHYAALSMFIPDGKYEEQGWNQKFRSFQWYKAVGWDKAGW